MKYIYIYLETVVQNYIYRVGHGKPPVYMTSDMVSDMVNFSLGNQMSSLKLDSEHICSRTLINWGEKIFNNPWIVEDKHMDKKDARKSVEGSTEVTEYT